MDPAALKVPIITELLLCGLGSPSTESIQQLLGKFDKDLFTLEQQAASAPSPADLSSIHQRWIATLHTTVVLYENHPDLCPVKYVSAIAAHPLSLMVRLLGPTPDSSLELPLSNSVAKKFRPLSREVSTLLPLLAPDPLQLAHTLLVHLTARSYQQSQRVSDEEDGEEQLFGKVNSSSREDQISAFLALRGLLLRCPPTTVLPRSLTDLINSTLCNDIHSVATATIVLPVLFPPTGSYSNSCLGASARQSLLEAVLSLFQSTSVSLIEKGEILSAILDAFLPLPMISHGKKNVSQSLDQSVLEIVSHFLSSEIIWQTAQRCMIYNSVEDQRPFNSALAFLKRVVYFVAHVKADLRGLPPSFISIPRATSDIAIFEKSWSALFLLCDSLRQFSERVGDGQILRQLTADQSSVPIIWVESLFQCVLLHHANPKVRRATLTMILDTFTPRDRIFKLSEIFVCQVLIPVLGDLKLVRGSAHFASPVSTFGDSIIQFLQQYSTSLFDSPRYPQLLNLYFDFLFQPGKGTRSTSRVQVPSIGIHLRVLKALPPFPLLSSKDLDSLQPLISFILISSLDQLIYPLSDELCRVLLRFCDPDSLSLSSLFDTLALFPAVVVSSNVTALLSLLARIKVVENSMLPHFGSGAGEGIVAALLLFQTKQLKLDNLATLSQPNLIHFFASVIKMKRAFLSILSSPLQLPGSLTGLVFSGIGSSVKYLRDSLFEPLISQASGPSWIQMGAPARTRLISESLGEISSIISSIAECVNFHQSFDTKLLYPDLPLFLQRLEEALRPSASSSKTASSLLQLFLFAASTLLAPSFNADLIPRVQSILELLFVGEHDQASAPGLDAPIVLSNALQKHRINWISCYVHRIPPDSPVAARVLESLIARLPQEQIDCLPGGLSAIQHLLISSVSSSTIVNHISSFFSLSSVLARQHHQYRFLALLASHILNSKLLSRCSTDSRTNQEFSNFISVMLERSVDHPGLLSHLCDLSVALWKSSPALFEIRETGTNLLISLIKAGGYHILVQLPPSSIISPLGLFCPDPKATSSGAIHPLFDPTLIKLLASKKSSDILDPLKVLHLDRVGHATIASFLRFNALDQDNEISRVLRAHRDDLLLSLLKADSDIIQNIVRSSPSGDLGGHQLESHVVLQRLRLWFFIALILSSSAVPCNSATIIDLIFSAFSAANAVPAVRTLEEVSLLLMLRMAPVHLNRLLDLLRPGAVRIAPQVALSGLLVLSQLLIQPVSAFPTNFFSDGMVVLISWLGSSHPTVRPHAQAMIQLVILNLPQALPSDLPISALSKEIDIATQLCVLSEGFRDSSFTSSLCNSMQVFRYLPSARRAPLQFPGNHSTKALIPHPMCFPLALMMHELLPPGEAVEPLWLAKIDSSTRMTDEILEYCHAISHDLPKISVNSSNSSNSSSSRGKEASDEMVVVSNVEEAVFQRKISVWDSTQLSTPVSSSMRVATYQMRPRYPLIICASLLDKVNPFPPYFFNFSTPSPQPLSNLSL